MPKAHIIEDHIGQVYGRLTVMKDAKERNDKGNKLVLCRCSCGRGDLIKIPLNWIVSGNTKSCGCRTLPERGRVFKNKSGLEYKILDYEKDCNGRTRILIRFLGTGSTKNVSPKEANNGVVKDNYAPSIAGVGYVGDGDFKAKGEHILHYQTWSDMIKRCYKPKSDITAKNYKDVTVCDEWHNYQVFAKWFDENYVEGWHLDKDLKVFGNKIYSPATCVFVPADINSFLTGGLKRGIHFNKAKRKWIAQCQNGEICSTGKKKQTYLGSFDNESDALNTYKEFKLNKLGDLRVKYSNIDTSLFDNIEKFILGIK